MQHNYFVYILTNKNKTVLYTGVTNDLMLPYTFDVSIYSYINNSDLLEHIRRVGKEFYQKNNKMNF